MHEIGLCQAILEAVDKRTAGRPVARVGVRSGVLNHVDREAMQQGFEMVSMGGPFADVELDVEIVPGEATCNDCQRTTQVEDLFSVCSQCGSPDITVEGGDELTVAWIEYREVGAETAHQ